MLVYGSLFADKDQLVESLQWWVGKSRTTLARFESSRRRLLLMGMRRREKEIFRVDAVRMFF